MSEHTWQSQIIGTTDITDGERNYIDIIISEAVKKIENELGICVTHTTDSGEF